MVNPFKIIESKITSREEFDVVDGFQPTHCLIYLKEGSFVVDIEGRREKMSAGDCIILPDYIYFRRNVCEPIVFVYVKFACNTQCPFSMQLPYGKVDFIDRERFLCNITVLEKMLYSDDLCVVGYREHILNDILFQVYFEQNGKGISQLEFCYSDRLINDAAEYIESHICQKIAVEDICSALLTNASTLGFKFRRETGMSVGEFITDRRMKKAEHLLLSSTYNISEIARRCGYDNVYYFSTVFKKTHGTPPSAYRD